MNRRIKCLVAVVLLALPIEARSQVPNAAPLLWRDGFIDHRGKLVRAEWQIVAGEDGSKFAIDMGHLDRKHHYVAAYQIGDGPYDPKNLFEFHFDCKRVTFVLANMDLIRAGLVERKARELACGGSHPAGEP
jgi:hypothetical protein